MITTCGRLADDSTELLPDFPAAHFERLSMLDSRGPGGSRYARSNSMDLRLFKTAARIDFTCDVRRRHQRNGEKLDPLIGPPLCYVGQTRCSITRFPSWWVKKLTAIRCGKICFRHFAQGGAQGSCARKVSSSLWTLTKPWACAETTRPQKIQFEVMVLSPQLINAAVRTSALPVCTRASLTFFWFTIGPFAWDHAVCRATAPSRWPAML
jgi:hypothetical protein